MLEKLSRVFSYTVMASVTGITLAIIAVFSFAVFYTTTKETFLQWSEFSKLAFTFVFCSMPFLSWLGIVCALRARKNDDKGAVIGMMLVVGPVFYAGFVLLLFTSYMISFWT